MSASNRPVRDLWSVLLSFYSDSKQTTNDEYRLDVTKNTNNQAVADYYSLIENGVGYYTLTARMCPGSARIFEKAQEYLFLSTAMIL